MTTGDADAYCAERTRALGGDAWLVALFAPPGQRPVLEALGALRADLVHLVAHRAEPQVLAARAGWWQQELAEIGQRPAQHPATRVLAPLAAADPALRAALLDWALHLNEEFSGLTQLDAARWRAHLARCGRQLEVIARLTAGPADAANALGPTLAEIDHLATLGQRLSESRPARAIGPAPDLTRPDAEAQAFVAERARALRRALAPLRDAVRANAPLAVLAALGARRIARLARAPERAWREEPARSVGALFTAWRAAFAARP